MAHTPAPWEAKGWEDGTWSIAAWAGDTDGGHIAELPYELVADEANARLIAAAPLMLEELEYVASGLAHIDTPWAIERLGFVQEVIKQAKGE